MHLSVCLCVWVGVSVRANIEVRLLSCQTKCERKQIMEAFSTASSSHLTLGCYSLREGNFTQKFCACLCVRVCILLQLSYNAKKKF